MNEKNVRSRWWSWVGLLLCMSFGLSPNLLLSQEKEPSEQERTTHLSSNVLEAELLMISADSLYKKREFDRAINIYLQLASLEGTIPYKIYGKALKKLGHCYRYKNVYDKSLEYFDRYTKLYPEHLSKKQYGKGLNLLAEVYSTISQNDIAYKLNLKSLAVQEEIGDTAGIRKNYYDIGTLFYYQAKYERSLEYYLKCQAIPTQDSGLIYSIYAALGAAYLKLENFETAFEYNKKSYEIAKARNDYRSMAYAYQNLGQAYFEEKDHLDNALFYLEKSADYFDKADYPRGKAISYNNLGRVQYELGNYQKAIVFYKNALEIAKILYLRKVKATSLEGLADSYEALGLYKLSVEHLRQSFQLQDSILNLETVESMATQKSAYILQKKDRELEMRQEIFEKENRFNTILQRGGLGVGIFLVGFLVILYWNNTKLKKTQLELEARKNKIETQNEELAKTNRLLEAANSAKELANQKLELANKKLESANEQLSNYAYVASHDLKEPLRTIQSFSQLIQRQAGDKFDEKTNTYFEYIISGVTRMKSFVDNLLKYSRIDRVNESMTPVDMNDLLQEVVSSLQGKIKEVKASVNIIRDLPEIVGIPIHFSQLFQNIISNGIKFKRPGIAPVIEIDWKETPEEFQFSIKDNGIGMPPEAQNKVFEMFSRLHKEHRYSGTGIGLATCKRIVDFYKGEIWVESVEGEGSTFFFTIPKEGKTV